MNAKSASVPTELVVIGDALVGKTVSEEDHAGDVTLVLDRRDLLAPAQPALAEVGRTARVNASKRSCGTSLCFGSRSCRRRDHVDLVVVGHDREAVTWLQE